MSYSIQQHGSTGEFKSQISGKAYPFKVEMTGADKRRARAEMEADHREVERNLADRLGRRPTLRELQHGVAPADTRDRRTAIAEDMSLTSSTPRNTTTNPYKSRIAELEAAPARARQERAQRKRRLEQAKQSAIAWQERQDARVAAEKETERIKSDLLDAQTNVNLAKYGTGFTGDDIRVVEKLQADLESSHDVETYHRERDAWEASVRERRDEAAQHLEDAANEQRELAGQIRAGEAQAEETSNND